MAARPEKLIFPRGVGHPDPHELPAQVPAIEHERLALARSTVFVTGFVEAPSGVGNYKSVIEANVHATRLWPTVRALVETLLPDAAAPLIALKGEPPVFGPYTTRRAALDVFEPYADFLAHDGFLEFGVMFQWQGFTEEIFVPAAKFLRIWTSRPDKAASVFEAYGIARAGHLAFIDEYPLLSRAQPFGGFDPGFTYVFEQVKHSFDGLPEPGFSPPEA